jgi:hypothetical protein
MLPVDLMVSLSNHEVVPTKNKSPDASCEASGLSHVGRYLGRVAEGGKRPASSDLELADRTESVGVDAKGPEVLGLWSTPTFNRVGNSSCAAEDFNKGIQGRKELAGGAHLSNPFRNRPNCRFAFMSV